MSAAPVGRPGRGWMGRLAHDLRGPLSPLKTAVFLLRSERLDPSKRVEMLDLIDRQGARLSAMIDELGDWARVEQGRLTLDFEETSVALLLHELSEPAQGAAVEIQFDPGTEDLRLQGDAARLRQLLGTLGSVRLAHNDKQPVRLHVELVAPARVRVLRRFGCSGKAVELAGQLLDGPLPDPQDDGLGLGLMMARAIADAHDGSLRVQAIDADTIEIVVELPLAPASKVEALSG